MKVSKEALALITYQYLVSGDYVIREADFQKVKAAFFDIDDHVKEFCESGEELDSATIKESFELFKQKHSNVFPAYQNITAGDIFCGLFLEAITEYLKNRKSNVYTVVDECDGLTEEQLAVVAEHKM